MEKRLHKDSENKEQTAREELENLRRRSKPLEKYLRISTEVREFEKEEQTARKRL